MVRILHSQIQVSIHAPARGATAAGVALDRIGEFQSTHPHGVRRALCAATERIGGVSIHAPARGATSGNFRNIPSELFQSTHPHGVRLRRSTLDDRGCHVSIHAPARGATTILPLARAIEQVSIHAPARGATKTPTAATGFATGFNPRTRTGCDADVLSNMAQFVVSIHAPARGATR